MSVSAPTINPHQPSTFEPQVLIHPAVRAVDPFLNLDLIDLPEMIDGFLVTDDVLADRLAAFLLHFEHPVADADQLTAATQGICLNQATQRCQTENGYGPGEYTLQKSLLAVQMQGADDAAVFLRLAERRVNEIHAIIR